MWEQVEERLTELGRRAGVTGVPAPVIAASLALCAIACAWGVWRFWPRGTDEDGVAGAVAPVGAVGVATGGVPAGQPGPGAAQGLAGGTTAAATATGAPEVVVHVTGAVRRPGVYELPPGSRVADAVEAAGGALPDGVLDAVNLARVVADGEQVGIPDEDAIERGTVPGAAAAGVPAAPGGGATGSQSPAPVDLNTADAAALDGLPGIGPATAQKIIADREANGPFSSVEDLSRVPGIGEKKVAQLEGLACVR